jgi:hypothetical protein
MFTLAKTRRKQLRILFPCLFTAGGLGMAVIPAHSQPPAARTEAIIDSVEQDWQNLRQQTGAKEFLDPQGTITAYQKFYETEGYRSGQTAVEITGIIAQLYWQGLDNPKKALSIYDWGLQNFASFRGITNLKRGRAVVAQMGDFAQTYTLPLAQNDTENLQQKTAGLKPVTIESPAKVLSQAVDGDTPASLDDQNTTLAPVTLDANKTPGITIAPTNNPFAPVTVTPPANGEKATQNNLIVIPAQAENQIGNKSTFSAVTVTKSDSQTSSKVLSPVAPDNQISQSATANIASVAVTPSTTTKSTFNQVTVSAAETQTASTTLSPVTPDNQNAVSLTSKELSVIPPPTPVSAARVSELQGVDPHQLALANAASAVRGGSMTIDDFLTQTKLTPQDAMWMLSAPGVIVSWDQDRSLRVALIGLIESQAPQLLQTPEKLPQATQMALADYYTSQRSPQAEPIYQMLISEKTPDGAWWPKLWVMNNLAEYYGAMGQFDKAAQAKLAIQSQTTAESWTGNTNIEAARFYMQAGETEKAQALYQKAEKSSFGWASGMAFVDQGRILMAQGKYKEAIKLLLEPAEGSLSNQIEVVQLSLAARAYYLSGDLNNAITYSDKAISQYQQLKYPLQNEGLDELLNSAKDTLGMSKIWQGKPFIAEPGVVNFNNNENGFVIVKIRQYHAAPISVTTTSSLISAKLVYVPWPEETEGKLDTYKEVYCKMQRDPPKDSTENAIIVRSYEYPNYELRIPVRFN